MERLNACREGPYLNFIDIEPANFISVPFKDHARPIQVRLRREEGSRPPSHPRRTRLPQELQLLHRGQPRSGQHGGHGHSPQRQADDDGRGRHGGEPEQDHGAEFVRRGSNPGEQRRAPSFSKVFAWGAGGKVCFQDSSPVVLGVVLYSLLSFSCTAFCWGAESF